MRAVNTGGGKCAGWKAVLKGEAAFFTGVLCVLFFTFGGPSLLGLSGALLANGLSFAVIFSVMLWLSFGVVRHAECLAEKLGEGHGGHGAGSTTFHAAFLILSLLPIVLLSKKIAALLDFGLVSGKSVQRCFVTLSLSIRVQRFSFCPARIHGSMAFTVSRSAL